MSPVVGNGGEEEEERRSSEGGVALVEEEGGGDEEGEGREAQAVGEARRLLAGTLALEEDCDREGRDIQRASESGCERRGERGGGSGAHSRAELLTPLSRRGARAISWAAGGRS